MNKLNIFIVVVLIISTAVNAQRNIAIPPPPCYANGNSGFGGAVGLNSFMRGSEAGFGFTFSLFNGGEFNDVLVLYIANGAPGRSVIDATIDDDADAHRIAISNSNVFGYGSTITFPGGFEATHAIAVDVDFGGLWSIPSSGNVGSGGLQFITSVNSDITSNTQTTPFSISFDLADLGLTEGDDFYYVGLYVSHQGYNSDEGYGDGITPGTEGNDPVVFTGYRSYNTDCNATLSSGGIEGSMLDVAFYGGMLHITVVHDFISVKTIDIAGKVLQTSDHHVSGSMSIPVKIETNQLQFIVIEGANSRKVLKVIPN